MLQELFNVLDLPGSSVRDIFAGENPLDQWASPLSDRHRVSGAELVSKYTGARSDSWGSTIAGFGAEMLLDPTNLIGGAGMLKRAVAARRAMTANKSIDALNAGAEAANLGRYGMVNAGRVDDLSSPLTALPVAVPESITGRGLPYDPMVGYQAEPFYSKIQEVAERGKLPNRVGPDQLRGTLLGAGVSPEELDDLASPLSEAFASSAPSWKLTRDDVYDVGADSVYDGLQISSLGGDAVQPAWDKLQRAQVLRNDMFNYVHHLRNDSVSEGDRYLAGLLQKSPELQDLVKNPDEWDANLRRLNDDIEKAREEWFSKDTQFASYQVPGGIPGTYQETLIRTPGASPYDRTHFSGYEDTVVHVRSDVAKLPDGRDTLRIMELQSDRHQKGSSLGYLSGFKPGQLTKPKADALQSSLNQRLSLHQGAPLIDLSDMVGAPMDDVRQRMVEAIKGAGLPPGSTQRYLGEYDDPMLYRSTPTDLVPDAAFKNSWHELGLKAALHKAVTEGFDTISLVKGADSAAASNGPLDSLGKFYDEKIFLALKKMIKKHGGDVKEVSVREANEIDLDVNALSSARRHFETSPLTMSVFEIPKSLKKEILRKGLPTYGTGSPLDPAIYGKTPERMIGSVQVKDVLRRSAGDSPLMPSEDLMTSPLMPRQEVPRILRPREAFGLVAYNAGARSGGYTVEP